MAMNFNRASLSLETVNVAINDAIERAAAIKAELPRPYLGASIVGDGLFAPGSIRLVVQTHAVRPCARYLRARPLLRGRRTSAPDRRRLQVRAARSVGVLRCEWMPARPR